MVEIADSESLERWLKGRPREVAVIVAARAALRVTPLLFRAFDRKRSDRDVARVIVLPVLRGTAAPWVAGTWPTRGAEVRESTADAAAYAAYTADAADAADAAYAAAVRAAADAAAYAVRAAAAADAAEDIWNAVSRDATALDNGTPLSELGTQSLWDHSRPGSRPGWANEHWLKLKRALLALDEDWEVWTDWYEARLRGGPANEDLEVARVLIDEEIWNEGPKAVNARIRELIEEYENSANKTRSQEKLPLESVPPQGPGPHFRTNEEGLLDRASPTGIDADGNDLETISQLKPLVLRCASDLKTRLSRNEFPELLDTVEKYEASLNPESGVKIEWGEVWGLGVLLQNAADSAARKIESRILPALEDPAKTALDSLLTMHGPMVLASRDGAKLSEMAAGFSMTREQQDALRLAAQQVAERLKASPEIVTPRAAESLSNAAETMAQGPHPERGSVYGLATVKNISIVLIGGAAAATPAVIGALLGATLVGAVAGAPFSLVVVEAVKRSAAFTALVTQLGARLDAITDVELQAWLEARARRLAPFRSFVKANQEPLRKIAEATPELKWMLKYIDFIAGNDAKQQ